MAEKYDRWFLRVHAFSQEAPPVSSKGFLNLSNKIITVHLIESGNSNEGELKEILTTNGYHVLAKKNGTVVSRDTISRHLRGMEYDGRNRIIDLRIARIRQKLGDRARFPKFIRTVRGEGYMLIVDDS